MKKKVTHKTYILSVLSVILLITTSLEIYLPIVKTNQEILFMFFFNLLGLTFLHNYCNRGKFTDYNLQDEQQPIETKMIFFCQLLIIVQLLLIVILYIFFATLRINISDLVVLLILQTYLFSMGNKYNFLKE
jgi:hypothetical protein